MSVQTASISIGELARNAGVSPDTLRHYERRGVLPAPGRASNGYRLFQASAVDRVRLVRRALSMGFTLKELGRILSERDRGGTPCRKVRALAREKLVHIENRLSELKALRMELRQLLKEWDERLCQTPEGKRAGLLDSLAARPPQAHSHGNLFRPKRPPLE